MNISNTKTTFIIRATSILLSAGVLVGVGYAAFEPTQPVSAPVIPAQEFRASASVTPQTVTRDSYTVTEAPEPEIVVAEVPHAVADPGTAQAIAYDMVMARGWGQREFDCLVALWDRESGWNMYASNPSGAYGVPQALPGSKMGPGWETDINVQLNWGVNYIAGRYGTPCGAWAASETQGWY